ncbi:S8 family serine peptidase [Streptomyces sp. NPDC007851]|uniref:S8 family serine peptidase n=1 Tax=Streptomyces sp. NPDC007851 TaxID=3155008 RepID=UPI0033C3B07B
MTDDSPFLRRPARAPRTAGPAGLRPVCGSGVPRLSVLAPLLGAVLAVAPAVGASAVGDATASPSASSSAGPRLPLTPSSIDPESGTCAKVSPTQVGATPWAQLSLDVAQANKYTQGNDVLVGVVDTGVAPQAAGLAGRVLAAGAAAQDCVGHGTFLAGVIAASAVPGSGFAGVAPGARIVAERGTDQWGQPSAELVAQGIDAAVAAGAKVVDVSAALSADTAPLRAALKHAAAKDVLVVAPAAPDTAPESSSGQASGPPPASYWPAAADRVVSVLDVDINGAHPEGVPQPVHADLAAPGDGITGIGPKGTGNYVANGASVAAAFVAGTAALVRAHLPHLTAAQTAARLKATAAHASVPLLDPSAALSTVLPTAAPSAALDPALHLPEPAPTSRLVPRAWALAGACLLLGVLTAGAMTVARLRTSRRRADRNPA